MSPGERRLHRFACLTAGATLLLIVAGGLVTSTGSGLAVPDWPLSYGRLMPPMVGGIRYEHGHRMVAGVVAVLTLVLAVWLARAERRRWVVGLGAAALGAVLLQALLGGLTVLFLLPPQISIAHACLAQTFFCLVVTIALVTSPRWPVAGASGHGETPGRALSAAVFAAVYFQLLLGALMRHTDSGLAIPDFPLSFGRLVPPHWDGHIAVHFAHRVWALVVLGLGVVLGARFARSKRSDLARPARLLLVLLPVQIALGALTVLSLKQVAFTTAHVATGAGILAVSLVLAVRSRVAAGVPAAPGLPPSPAATRLSPASP